ncbi:Hypothetical protein NTJ_00020 [Nesidiocoris tenuis]|uniref:Uncharacterized protein n=1 Tax=Nesidiocoris tenuis TaxID=355587 RepID=A0ABN7A5A8_9HEMI|nr:Hypothetical protein NTJ_00020 [Nesidiocoris tenuis]
MEPRVRYRGNRVGTRTAEATCDRRCRTVLEFSLLLGPLLLFGPFKLHRAAGRDVPPIAPAIGQVLRRTAAYFAPPLHVTYAWHSAFE